MPSEILSRSEEKIKIPGSIINAFIEDRPFPRELSNGTLYIREVPDSEGQRDVIFVYREVELPEGMSVVDIQDAIDRARRFEGQQFGITVFVRESLGRRGRVGIVYGDGSVGISVEGARLAARLKPLLWIDRNYMLAPAREQLWAAAFEEAMHEIRRMAGKDKGPYFKLPEDYTLVDYGRYLAQEQERVVDNALNGGILVEKFGRGRWTYQKCVLMLRPWPDVLYPPLTDQTSQSYAMAGYKGEEFISPILENIEGIEYIKNEKPIQTPIRIQPPYSRKTIY